MENYFIFMSFSKSPSLFAMKCDMYSFDILQMKRAKNESHMDGIFILLKYFETLFQAIPTKRSNKYVNVVS